MALPDVMLGLQTWSDYVSTANQGSALREALRAQQSSLVSSQRESRLATDAGFDTLGYTISTSVDWLAGGIADLRSDFNLLMGETIWLLQLQEAHLKSILETLQAPLDTSARELRRRAERAYENGWYEEALADFLDSAERNYQDFAVHRSIANIHLFHRRDLNAALEYFLKTAKYARAVDAIQSAEAHYYAGITQAALMNFDAAAREFETAAGLNARFLDAF